MSDHKSKDAANDQAKPGCPPATGSAWQNASDCKPKTGCKVLVCGHWDNGKRWRTMAAWYPAGTLDATMWDDPPEDWWDEQENTATNPEDGWMEMPIEGEQMYGLENVTHWMPLPEMPMPNDRTERSGGKRRSDSSRNCERTKRMKPHAPATFPPVIWLAASLPSLFINRPH